MRIFEQEKLDGIDFDLNSHGNAKSFVQAEAGVGNLEKYSDGISMAELLKAGTSIESVEDLLGQDQPDLALIVSILVSAGWNLNDDIFLPDELWRAKDTPKHKPMNDEHNIESILGHIVASRVLNKDGEEIQSGDSLPDEFDIEVAGVLYKAYPELRDRIDEIISKANSGDMFVSMEVWFPDFDYGIIDQTTGATKVLSRSEKTAFLTKHLRAYGGNGLYEGFRVGRVLRDLVFGAQGFVSTPANPDSVIKVAANQKVAASKFVETEEIPGGGVEDMADELKELQAKLDEAMATIKERDERIAELETKASAAADKDEAIAKKDEEIEGLKTQVTEASEKVETVSSEKAELQKQLDEATSRADKSEKELEEVRKTEAARERFAQLAEVKTIEDEEATLAELREMSDETFAVVLKYAGEQKASEASAEADNTEVDEAGSETDEAEQAEASLENVESNDEADLSSASESEADRTQENYRSLAMALCGRKDDGENK